MRPFVSFCIAFAFCITAIFLVLWQLLGPVGGPERQVVFVVPQNQPDYDVVTKLHEANLIRNVVAFRWFMMVTAKGISVVPGGYRLNPSMNAREVTNKLTNAPQLVWVMVREGLRQEQIGELLATKLGWTVEQENEWNRQKGEGQFFPDTYLLPVDESVSEVTKRFFDRFNEKFASYVDQFTAKNIIWTTGIKIASLIERESGGDSDKRLIAGVIWNRLNIDMKLEIDATLQYIKGNSEIGWWPRVVPADKYLDSTYNTYRFKGLPPGPISNPGLAAIEAALNPEETDCIFYLHAPDKSIHCSVTYAEHVENIKKYLQ